MKTYRVCDLEDALLDAAVAKAEGIDVGVPPGWVGAIATALHMRVFPYGPPSYSPSSKWDQGGPIIERERICFLCSTMLLPEAEPQHWVAKRAADWHKDTRGEGPTQLIAAMRAYVASKFGETVVLP